MIGWPGALLTLVLAGLPLLVLPSRPIVGLGALAAALCTGGLLGRSVAIVTAGAACALAEYALALWLAATPVSLLASAAFGVTLVLLLDVVDFLRRVRGVAVDPAVMRGQVRYWIRMAATGAAVIVVVALGATALPLALPAGGAAVLATAGALGTFLGVVRALGQGDA